LNEVRRAIEQITPTALATDLDTAIRRAHETLGGREADTTNQRREIYVFSDAQHTALRQRDTFDLGPTTGLLMVSARPDATDTANLSVDAVQYGASRPMLGVPFTFRALITNHGNTPRTTAVDLVLNDEIVHQKEIEIPAGRSKMVRFTHRFTEPNWHRGSVRLAADEGHADLIPADDARHFALRVAEQVRVLAVNGAPSTVASRDELLFFRLALTVQPETRTPIALESVRPDDFNTSHLTDADRLVVLANVATLAPDTLEALERFVDRGGRLLITLGDRVRADEYNQWLGNHRLHGGLLPARLVRLLDDNENANGVGTFEAQHPALAGFETGALGDFSGVRFEQHYQLEPRNADVLMRGGSDTPLLLEKRFGQGRVMLFASSIDRDWTNFPLQPTYVPWLYRIVGHLAQPAVGEANFVRTGDIVALPTTATRVEPMRIERPDGTVAYPEANPRRDDAAAQAVTDTAQAGVYTVRRADRDDASPLMFAANTPPEESELTYFDRDTFLAQAGEDAAVTFIDSPEDIGSADTLARQGYGLWDALLWLALIVALVEPWIANQLSRRRAARVTDALGQRDVLPGQPALREPETVASAS
ncbi:MAG: hypothetical protein ACODAQ_13130, partial [Phycisphaeraceae bacterium]